MKSSRKYVLCPGFVTSKNDGDRHYINAYELARLYNVSVDDCEIYDPAPWWPPSFYRYAREDFKDLLWLKPRYSGNYSLPD
jgi:hypothetical protein